jgi:hypothetical protein
MTIFSKSRSVAVAFAIVATGIAGASAANAAGAAKEFFVQEYQFAKPMHGYSGFSNNYYCDYQRKPNRVCTTKPDGTEKCRIVNWVLTEMCQ